MAQESIRKMAVLGNPSVVAGFAGLGLEVLALTAEQKADELLRTACESEKYAAIYLTEDLVPVCQHVIAHYKDQALPVIVPIPGSAKPSGLAEINLHEAVRRAIGFDINKKEQK
ncbi:V-type ATP synthase subunit F [Amygdalobacter nucleatus]|uniref:ATP synthase, subunit F n=1 Tax=Amygdalobacter nucleatus TaxID=3029274 RepID=A0A133YG82_9FIRM|nr:V-type ATP synthase subunit F [Amygdalobacter nucleatus]KXB42196.1 ATP synthase, subunit F [Amygdalobacter nucleatus]MDF0486421.1 V-type ATP synthase subunit F [Amygdalobacter nucleatus]WEG37027.1 V-type ATP synthase subunit F [Amygdalobacter nucleatus]